MPREGQKQEHVPLQMATQATMYDKYTKNFKIESLILGLLFRLLAPFAHVYIEGFD